MGKNSSILAGDIANTYGTRNPFALCRALNVLVIYQNLVDMRGFYMHYENCDIVTLAKDLPEHVTEFVCAHELGHCLVHKGLNRVFLDSRTFMLPDRYENEADGFAAHLLYGETPLFSERELNERQMAECLNVPPCNVNTRLAQLGVALKS